MKKFILSLCLVFMTSFSLAQSDSVAEKISSNLSVIALSDAELDKRFLTREKLGILHVPTGEIVISDMLVNQDRPAFARTVAPGDYEVYLYRTKGNGSGIALAELRFTSEQPVKWELALLEGQDMSKLEDDQFYGFPVDAGIGSFYDKSAVAEMAKRETLEREKLKRDEINYFDDVLFDEMYPDGTFSGPIMHQPMEDSPLNFAIFSSGWGDGYYPTFWGFDKNGNVASLVIDFFVANNGDGRNEAEQFSDIMSASMSEAEKQASSKAYTALEKDDLDTLESLLKSGEITPKTWTFKHNSSLQYEALIQDKAKVMKLLVQYGADGSVTDFIKSNSGNSSLLQIAKRLNGYDFRRPISDEMMQLLASLPVK